MCEEGYMRVGLDWLRNLKCIRKECVVTWIPTQDSFIVGKRTIREFSPRIATIRAASITFFGDEDIFDS